MQIEMAKLSLSKENPRKTPASQAAHDSLVASMVAHGQIIPLVVRPNGSGDSYIVVDGGRRFAAMAEAGILSAECVVNETDFGDAELGTAANMMRAAMHPLDECDVIARLVADGEDAGEVAGRFGQTERWALQRMKLNDLSAKVKKLFRDGAIGISAAMAFTLGNHKEQDDYVRQMKEPWHSEEATIRRYFTHASFDMKHAWFPVEKIPRTSLIADLFSEVVLCADRKLYETLQKAAIEAKAKELMAEEGWSDVIVFWNGINHAVFGKYVKVSGRITKKDREKLTCFIAYNPSSGEAKLDAGYALRKQTKVTKGAQAGDDKAAADDVTDLTADDLSGSQLEIMGAYLTKAIEAKIDGGDVWLALKTIVQPLLDPASKAEWTTVRPSTSNYIPVNVMLSEKFENSTDNVAVKFPSRTSFDQMAWDKVGELICTAALRAMQIMKSPYGEALKIVKDDEVPWMGLDEGFLKRYRTDQLTDLAERLRIKVDGDKKNDVIRAILAAPATDPMRYIKLPKGD
jgi:ParB/RepB/Spo0J family partition protein